MDPHEALLTVVRQDGRYALEGYYFLFRALALASHKKGQGSSAAHVSGRDIIEAVRELGRREFGFLAKMVFNAWGVRRTTDFGHMVFLLVEHGLMGARESDSLEDFREGFDFSEAFEKELPLDFGTSG